MQNYIEDFHDWVNKGVPYPLTDAPSVYIRHSALMSLSAALGRRYYIPFAGRKLYPNLWTVLVGKSSFFHKSTAISLGMKILEAVEKECKFPNDFSREQLISTLDAQPSGIFIPDEFTTFYTLFGRNYMSGGIGFLTEMYDRYSSYEKELRSGERFFISEPYICIFSATTIEGLESELKSEDIRNGFLARFQFVIARKKDMEVEMPGASDHEKELSLVSLLKKIREGGGKLELSQVAENKYRAWHNNIMKKYQYEMQNGLSGFISRILVVCIKNAMLYHLASEENIGNHVIDEISVGKACEVSEELIMNAIFLLSSMCVTPYERKRKKILDYLIAYDNTSPDKEYHGLTRSDLMRKVKMDKHQLSLIIDSLIEENSIEVDANFKSPDAKRNTTIYRISETLKKEMIKS